MTNFDQLLLHHHDLHCLALDNISRWMLKLSVSWSCSEQNRPDVR